MEMRVGMIGCGGVINRHGPHVRRLRGLEIVGVCDSDANRLPSAVRFCGVDHLYPDAAELLKEQHPDVVHILTPPATHKDLALESMEHGCHVLVEKPMAMNADEADEMIAASRRYGVRLGVCHNFLYEPAVVEARELVAQGAIGKVVSVDVFWRFYAERLRTTPWIAALPGGFVHEVAPHPVYLLSAFLENLNIESLLSQNVADGSGRESTELRVLFSGEPGLGAMSISALVKPYQVILTIYGTEMSLRVDLATNTLLKLRRDGLGPIRRKALANFGLGFQLFHKTIGQLATTHPRRKGLGHGSLIEKFYDSLQNGSPPPTTAEEGRKVVAVLDDLWSRMNRMA